MNQKHKVFISYHHENDARAKEYLSGLGIFTDVSLDTGDISDTLGDEEIRVEIRDNFLRNSTVTILLVGLETKNRKHIDWEIYSSMRDSTKNKKSGILIIQLPSTNPQPMCIAHDDEKVYEDPMGITWRTPPTRKVCEQKFPYCPERIIDNIMTPRSWILVARWSDLVTQEDPHMDKLRWLIDAAFRNRASCEYNLKRPLRRHNS
jgi:hypothetical protein